MPITALGFEGSANKVAVGIVRDGEVRSLFALFFALFLLSLFSLSLPLSITLSITLSRHIENIVPEAMAHQLSL